MRDLEKRLGESVAREQAADRALTEALEQQAATSEILRVISTSPTNAQPVFDTITRNALKLCGAASSLLTMYDGELLHLAALANVSPEEIDILRRRFPQRPDRGAPGGRAILTRAVVHIPDTAEDPYFIALRGAGQTVVVRSILGVPLLRAGDPIGALHVHKYEPAPFPESQIALLQTFADQAVIAIENARLFNELHASNADLGEALDKQTATSEILRAISRSPTEEQAVFDAIVRSAARLCRAAIAAVFRTDGTALYHPANYGGAPEALATIRAQYPRPLDMTSTPGIAILTRSTVEVPDVDDPSATDSVRHTARVVGFRSIVAIPMLREGNAVGAIVVGRREPGRFAEADVELLKTFADQAVIAIENVRLFRELEARNRALTESLEQQTATSDILRVISRSPADVQPVLDAVAESAARLCGADDAVIQTVDRDVLRLAAHFGGMPTPPEHATMPITREIAVGCAVLDRQTMHVHDMAEEHRKGNYPASLPLRARLDYRTLLCVPLVREDIAVGVVVMRRGEVRPFTDQQIALVQTFAEQAVIAIENVRLFNELEFRNRDLARTLEQQTATSEILGVISHSPTAVEPVFQAIVTNGRRLCHAHGCLLVGFDGEMMTLLASDNFSAAGEDALRGIFPYRATRAGTTGRVVLDRAVVHIPDVLDDPDHGFKDLSLKGGARAQLAVPMFRDNDVIGALHVSRPEPGPFSDDQIAVLKTFADQAVIAIENVRLFTKLQSTNRNLTEALDQQTATSEILKVISQSQTDVQPVFDAIVRSAIRLLRGYSGTLALVAGDRLELAALTSTDAAGDAALRDAFPLSLRSGGLQAQAIHARAPLNIADAQTDPRLPEAGRARARARGYRSGVALPLLRHDEAIGAIAVSRREAGGFTDDEISLIKTFADQAVIAIENARLLSELQARTRELTRSVEQLTALGDVGRAVSSSLDLDTVLTTIVGRAVQLSGTDGGTILEYDENAEEFVPRATFNADARQSAMLRATRLRRGEGAVGQLAVTREPLQIPDIAAEGAYESRLRGALLEAGTRALLAIPLLHEDRLVGGLVVSRLTPGEFTAEVVELLKTFATQSALGIQNARLFRELEIKGRQLELASQHKSEFLANMSHELRTPMNAILGFSEVLADGMFGEVNDKQAEYLRDILESGRHLLSLINDILDLSKIEAGRMELEPADFDLPGAIDNALTLVRERAGRRFIALGRAIDPRVGAIRADERKVKQVLLNLLSNALKFTPEGGRIDVRATVNDELVEVSVADTGVGIAPEDQEAVFEEFRQVGTADKKVEGTGLGLALSKKFIELHGGRIWVKSQVGAGSTFTFTLPLRRDAQ